MLDYYAKVTQQNAEARVAIAAADSVRAQAEREYAQKKAAEAREETLRQERARSRHGDGSRAAGQGRRNETESFLPQMRQARIQVQHAVRLRQLPWLIP